MNATRLPFVPSEEVEVLRRTWLAGFDRDPPTLELELTDSSFVKVAWDAEYNHRNLYVATDRAADYVTATGAETRLSEDVLGPICAEVEAACRSHDSNDRAEYLDDAMSFEDGRR